MPKDSGEDGRAGRKTASRIRPKPQSSRAPEAPASSPAFVSAAADPSLRAETGAAFWQKAALSPLLLGALTLAALAPLTALAALFLGLGALTFGFLALRLALLRPWGVAGFPRAPSSALREPDQEILPRITLLIALYREAASARHLLAALQALDYPRDRLEVLILLEQDDLETFAAFRALRPPNWIRLIVVPDGAPRTKPRALNWGLAEAAGTIVGVLDAEDRPERDQLRKAAAAFAQAPPETACLQARLGWYNASTNGLTRGLALEYAGWFGLLLPALTRLGCPIPLGGTSCYLRAEPLREVGGWDPWNVTEDADLGFKLARRGWRSATLDSLTKEEAVLTPRAWIRQRTRWIKGFLVTWIVHMRDPVRLWREIGPAGFWVFNALTLGSFLAYLALPLHLTALAWLLIAGEAPWSGTLPERVGRVLETLFWAGQGVATGMAFWGAWRGYGLRFAFWAPLLPLYLGIFGPLAALRAASQLPRSAFLWEKTAHGFDQGEVAPSLPAAPAGCVPAGRQDSRGAV
ncbi:glycosyltransferase family 2 protein [Neomegalonema perideroedes]|uniref:glycosyltransferase family 2 protein n=1 Tax=Neomegalonema perideroedes TaxID=217219 RepID=UPI0003A06E92|nr:glycosyltransferase family 2 protein [Neomegalonema perideroedes]